MNELLDKLQKFFKKNDIVIIVNTSNNSALLCLDPVIEIQKGMILLKFDSLNDRGGNSVYIKALQGNFGDTLYFENEVENILMLQPISMGNYNQYIRKQYTNAPSFNSLESIKEYIKSQL